MIAQTLIDSMHLSFPGRAGDLQREGRIEDLLTELRNDYANYHAWLVEEMDAAGKRPVPRGRDGRAFLMYLEENEQGTQIIAAALVLRLAAGDPLPAGLWDENGRLNGRRGDSQAGPPGIIDGWSPPPLPRDLP